MCRIVCAWEARRGLVKMGGGVRWFLRGCLPSKVPGDARAPSCSGAAKPNAGSLVAPDRLPAPPLETPAAAHSRGCQLWSIQNPLLALCLDALHLELGPGISVVLSCTEAVLIRQVADGKGDHATKLNSQT